ncbi:DUF4179 domain-containing protein [Romboutsia sedimentorum]|uniref:DUF4179 domain-containing protein n=1 Tax=Romboutsia sedimentorum TaxID=1368474 RepID=UPI0024DE4FC7|nr:DUF4179 domain-containing protein [Romboutsia sedimentorum]MDK2584704.1 DUF4179 domain-containing protein [Romboutsia sedimentorum]
MHKFNDIKVPQNIKEETKKTIRKGRRLKKKKTNQFLKIASVIILSIGVCIGTLNPSLANEIPFLNNLFKEMVFPPGAKDDYAKHSQDVNLTQTVNGVSVTIDEVVCDGHQIHFTYTVKSKNKLPRQKEEGFYKDSLLFDSKVSVKNGTATERSFGSKNYVDDYTCVGSQSYNLAFKGKKAPKTIKVDISIKSIYINEPDTEKVVENIEGPFNFKLKILPNTDVVVIDVNETKNGFTVDSLEITPYSVSVNVEFPKKFISKDEDFFGQSVYITGSYASSLPGESYTESTLKINGAKIKRGIVYDSIVADNIDKIGYYDINEYLVIKFVDSKKQVTDDVTEFKIYIDKQL